MAKEKKEKLAEESVHDEIPLESLTKDDLLSLISHQQGEISKLAQDLKNQRSLNKGLSTRIKDLIIQLEEKVAAPSGPVKATKF